MSKCLRGIPNYNTKIKAPRMQFDIERGLEEAETSPEAIHTGFAVHQEFAMKEGEMDKHLKEVPLGETQTHPPTRHGQKVDTKKAQKLLDKVTKLVEFNDKHAKGYQFGTKFDPIVAKNERPYSMVNDLGVVRGVTADSLAPQAYKLISDFFLRANKLAKKIDIPGLRGLVFLSPDVQRERTTSEAAMGDGVLNLSDFFVNKLFEEPDTSPEGKEKRANLHDRINNLIAQAKIKEKMGMDSSYEYGQASISAFEWAKLAPYREKKNQAPQTVPKYKETGKVAGNVDMYYTKPEHIMMATMYHEFGHHIHQQYAVNSIASLKKPKVEQILDRIVNGIGLSNVKHLSLYSQTHIHEWFAENYAYWIMAKQEGVAPLGKPEEVLDPSFVSLMREITRGTL